MAARWIGGIAAATYIALGLGHAGIWLVATNAPVWWCLFLVLGWLPWHLSPDAIGAALLGLGFGDLFFTPR